jgi:dephospho-CoA kinase
MNNKLILAVVGMAGSGKSEVIKYLQKTRKWPKVYFGEPTFDRLKKEGLEINYANERLVREKIRTELGMGAYAILCLPKIEDELKKSDHLLIESLYSWDEYKILKNKYGEMFKVVAVFASTEIRFQRLLSRSNERPMKDREEFETRDYTEIEKTDKGGPIARADFMIINESGLEALHENIENIIKKLIKYKS